MLAKILAVLLGIIGITTTTLNPPAKPGADTSTIPAPTVQTTVKGPAVTNNNSAKNTKDVHGDLGEPKSSVTESKIATTTAAKTPTKKPSEKPETKLPVKVAPPAVVTPKTPEAPRLATTTLTVTPPQPPPNWSGINQKTREATVNIICTSKHGGSFEPLSGSGVIIDPRGIILTNAHIAQYFLLENYRVKDFLTCVARTGSPATPKYTLKLLYISRQWLQENYKNISSQKPTGTGENDYALLQITGSTNPDLKLPATFPAIGLDDNEDNINTGDQALLASYPAGFLGGIAIQRDLYVVSTIINIGKRYTFRDGTLDAFSLGGSPVAQHGSSGGGAISGSGKLLGVIVTSTDAADTSKRDLDAISVAHINRSLSAEIHMTLDSLFASDITTFGKTFDEETLPNLKKLLVDELDSKNR